MPVFTYRARDGAGHVIRGRADAATERELAVRLRNQGLLVVGVEADKDLQVMIRERGGLFTRLVSTAEMAIFLRQFATMINAGLPVVTALKVQVRQASNPRLRRVLTDVLNDVEAGESLSGAFGRHGEVFPPVMVHMVAAGEAGGILDEVLNRLATQMEKDEQTRQKVRSALVYPTIVSVVAAAVVIFMMTVVVPRFTELYTDLGAELPGATNMLIAASGLARRFWLFGLAAAAALWCGVRQWRQTEQGGLVWDTYWLKVPIFGPLTQKQCIARFARTLAGLQSSGVTILRALAIVERTVGNRAIGKAVLQALEEVRQGTRLVIPLQRSGLFPPMVIEMISVGEETGTVEEMLIKVADFYDEEVQRTAERLSGSLEPIVIVILAATVGFIVISMMAPIFNLWTLIQ
jgi:type IV pilus assembly protein PilC